MKHDTNRSKGPMVNKVDSPTRYSFGRDKNVISSITSLERRAPSGKESDFLSLTKILKEDLYPLNSENHEKSYSVVQKIISTDSLN